MHAHAAVKAAFEAAACAATTPETHQRGFCDDHDNGDIKLREERGGWHGSLTRVS